MSNSSISPFLSFIVGAIVLAIVAVVVIALVATAASAFFFGLKGFVAAVIVCAILYFAWTGNARRVKNSRRS